VSTIVVVIVADVTATAVAAWLSTMTPAVMAAAVAAKASTVVFCGGNCTG
jgi:hypothetical protein